MYVCIIILDAYLGVCTRKMRAYPCPEIPVFRGVDVGYTIRNNACTVHFLTHAYRRAQKARHGRKEMYVEEDEEEEEDGEGKIGLKYAKRRP